MDFLNSLNKQQQAAVTAPDGAVLVLAGPGSGKTRVLTHRIAYLIASRQVNPYHILAVTFTNKAARVMESRVYDLVGSEQRGMMLGTFHSVCARILRREAKYLGYTQDFSIYDEDDQQALVKRALKEMNIDDKAFRPASMLASISRAKNEMLTPEKIEVKGYRDQVLQKVYKRYQELLLSCNALDFDDLLVVTAKLLKDFPEINNAYAQRFEYILVDEFQDTNTPQYTLLKSLAKKHGNIFVVGDEDQSIYRWRGADYHNVLRFEKDYPQCTKILLEQNYRSPQVILDAARAIIDRNRNRTVKNLFTNRGSGERIVLHEAPDDRSEAEYVVTSIQDEVKRKRSTYADFAVMYRTNAQSRLLEEAFLHAGIAYKLVGAQRFYGRREVKDGIAYLRLLHNLNDANSLERIINVPARGIGDKTIQALRDRSNETGLPATSILLDLVRGEESAHWRFFGSAAAHRLADFGSRLEEWLTAKDQLSLPELLKRILSDIDYHNYIEDESEEGADRWENVEELIRIAYEYEEAGLTVFLENMALIADQDTLPDQPSSVTLLTLHASKGLEFPIVFITGLDEKLLPHARSMEDEEEMSEERRLFYVGITRTRERLFLTRSESRAMYGGYDFTDPSRFLRDIPVNLLNQTGYRSSRNYASTGWGSSSNGVRTPASVQNQYVWKAPSSTTPSPVSVELKYQVNMRVNHPLYGEGLVLEDKRVGPDEIVVVEFDTVGLKRLDASLANLTIISQSGEKNSGG